MAKSAELRYRRLNHKDVMYVRAAAYLRTSTEDQELGIEAQKTQIQKWCVENKIQIDTWYIDQGVSGTVDPAQRPGFQQLLTRLDGEDLDYVIVSRLDRLSRITSMIGFIEFVAARAGARIITCDEKIDEPVSPEKQLLRTIVAGMAEYERSLISLRTKGALGAAKARGVKLGRRKRLSYKQNCLYFFVIRYLDKYGENVDFIEGYLLSQLKKQFNARTIRRFRDETEVPIHFPLKEIVRVLKPYYRKKVGGKSL